MTDINSLSQLMGQFDQFGNVIQNSTNNLITREDVEARINEEKQKSIKKWTELSTSIVANTKAMTTQEGAFNQLGNIAANLTKSFTSLFQGLPIVGGAIKGLGEGAAEGIKAINDVVGQSIAIFGKISGSGIVASYQNMIDLSKDTGLYFAELSDVLGKNSESLAMFGKTATDGSAKMAKILNANEKFALDFQKMGIGFEEFSEMQASYISQQIRTGGIRNKTEKELTEGARRYADELDTLSKLTGKQRSEIQKEQERLMNDARYRAKMRELERVDPAAAERMKNLISVMQGKLAEATKDAFASGGNIVNKSTAQAAIAFAQGGTDFAATIKDVITGAKSAEDGFTALANAAPAYLDATEEITGIISSDSDLTANFTDMANLAGHAGKSFTEIREEIEKNKKTQREQYDAHAEAILQSRKFSHSLVLSIASISVFSKAIAGTLGALERMKILADNLAAGKKDPETVKIAQEGKSYLTSAGRYGGAAAFGVAGASAGLKAMPIVAATGIGAPIAPFLPFIGAGIGLVGGYFLGDKAAHNIGEMSGINEAANPNRAANPNLGVDVNKLFNFANGTSREDFDKLDGNLKTRLIAAAQQYQKETITGKLTINSAFRSQKEQDAMYKETERLGTPGINKHGYPVGKISKHTSGLAVDVEEAKTNPGLFADYGLHRRISRDPVHLEMRNGGIVAPTSGGSIVNIAEAGQAEAVVPLPDGKSIPVAFNSNTDQSGLMKLFQNMNDKFDTMIDLLESSNSTQRNIAQNTA